MSDEPYLLTKREVSTLFGVSISTFDSTYRRLLRSVQVGSRVLFRAQDARALRACPPSPVARNKGGRPCGPPRLRLKGSVYVVRFTVRGRRYTLSTGERSLEAAERAAEKLLQSVSEPPSATAPGVYALFDGEHVKIGRATRSIAERARNIQIGHPKTLRLMILSRDPSDEKAFHAKLVRYRVRGEWFRAHPDVMRQLSRWEREA